MADKSLFKLTICAGIFLVLGATFIMIAQRLINAGDSMGTVDYILIAAGTVCSITAFVLIFILIVKILKEKKII